MLGGVTRMDTSTATVVIARKSWWCVAISVFTLAVGLTIALPFSTPTTVGYIALPGVLIGVVAACVCVTCFFVCPQRPLRPKILAGVLCVPALFCAFDFVAYYWLHVRYHG